MNKICMFIIAVLLTARPALAGLRVVASYPYIADLVRQIGARDVEVVALARGNTDPHFVVPRPSYIARTAKADLVIINGAQLEIGWIPPIISQANNPRVRPGTAGFLDLSAHVRLIEVPSGVSRAQGDVHPDGNPHFHLDPANIPVLASAVAARLALLDPGNAAVYRANLDAFSRKWSDKMKEWGGRMSPLKGATVVEYHRLYLYFLRRFGLRDAGNLEPLPGIPPTARHMEALARTAQNEHVRLILQDVYHSDAAARHLSARTGARVVLLPHDVGAVKESGDIFMLFDEIVRRIGE